MLLELRKLTGGINRHFTAAVTDIRQRHEMPVKRHLILFGLLLRRGKETFGALETITALRHRAF